MASLLILCKQSYCIKFIKLTENFVTYFCNWAIHPYTSLNTASKFDGNINPSWEIPFSEILAQLLYSGNSKTHSLPDASLGWWIIKFWNNPTLVRLSWNYMNKNVNFSNYFLRNNFISAGCIVFYNMNALWQEKKFLHICYYKPICKACYEILQFQKMLSILEPF